MDKLEQYLDQVCRGIGGPRSLRQHLRQELREHLQDAAAEHKAAGLSEEAALARALEDFGGPDQVRSELEATHGHRMMAVVIDKAMQWKEKSMKAKWLWTSWANLSLAVVLALEVFFITFNVIFIVPKFQKLMQDGIIDPAIVEEQGTSWMLGFLNGLSYVGGHYTTHLLVAALGVIGLFEWRVKSENKPFMRLSALGTVAVGLMVVIILMAGSLVISFTLGVPIVGRMARPWAAEQVVAIETSVSGLEQALAKKDWGAMQGQAEQASTGMTRLAVGPALSSLTRGNESQKVEELREQLQAARESFGEAQRAIRDKEPDRLKAALQKFHEAYGPIEKTASRAKE